jgi:predicted NBD/HSP70 family sugar kinase
MAFLQKNTTKLSALEYAMKRGSCSRKVLAEELSVTRANVTRIVSELLAEGYLYECGETSTGEVGRKEVVLKVKSDAGYALGIDISRSGAAVSVAGLDSKTVFYEELYYEALDETAFSKILLCASAQFEKYKDKNLLGIGVLVQGYIENDICKSMPIGDIKRRIEDHLGRECLLMNNVKAMALTERYLCGGEKNFILVKYGPGVGCAIVIDGAILEGAGELGHIALDSLDGKKCPVCGKRNCLESRVGYGAVIEAASGEAPAHITYEELIKASRLDKGAALSLALSELSRAVAFSAQLIAPDEILLAGDVFTDEKLLGEFKENLARFGGGGFVARPITDYSQKRKKAACIAVFDALVSKTK